MDQSFKVIQGIGASPGIAIGKAHVLERRRIAIPHHTLEDEKAIGEECTRFEAAVAKTELDLEDIKRRIHPELVEHVQVLEVYQMILRDRPIQEETKRLIREEKLNAQLALARSILKAGERFRGLDDEYIQNRMADLEVVGERVLRHLAGQEHNQIGRASCRERV
jgi:phosphotransferase system enzyme I (PtsI)